MQIFKNDCYLKAAFRKKVNKTPIWIMRQSGRYLPEYQNIKKKAGDFLSLCLNVELASQATLLPINLFSLDAAILFSDILIVPYAMGMNLTFLNDFGPCFLNPIKSRFDMEKLIVPHPEEHMNYVLKIIKIVCHEISYKIPLIGFSGSPWTLACYMIEGNAKKNFSKIKKMLYENPKDLHFLLKKLTDSVILYLNAQINAGVSAIVIFDTWGGILNRKKYKKFSLFYIQKIIKQLSLIKNEYKIPVTVFTKNANAWLKDIVSSGCDVIALDWSVDIQKALKKVGKYVALQGNMDPHVLYAEENYIQKETDLILSRFGFREGHIFSLGHGILPDTDPKKVKFLVDSVHQLSQKYHQKIY
ncbi:uroporphyrinogen decarboxylase [Wigglesworthia glossinidia endosymbiont of Glossina morsitans morsitans (Yale colony)]|uniref:Uroporphyrinogen decarboxylase n=1 Tax=Wigglesworthia glossinidia endosymbiont of Glossina morsitans morsitans (Yale colony) TaxID=1142511 RepID=H6Q4M9_WIGGL|nr:uroporphyrinogen decarboxylase [Wigglesworthia glossinidia]AFA41089.1 uroporphyrinogen decarboxylase [Wigglesworthia glossinidia endosymbiont of Glossina morsitans morsitans (Yale colony)]